MKVALFLEDAGQLNFLRALLLRIAAELGVDLDLETRNAVGGKGTAMRTFRQYVSDVARGADSFAEILVVSVDGNCRGWQDVSREIHLVAAAAGYGGIIVPAVPDPHIEAWYLSDGRAIVAAIGEGGGQPNVPARKCEPDVYKQLLREAFLSMEIDPPAGGTEYGEDVANALDLEAACRADAALARFCTDFRAAVRQISASARQL